MPTYEIVIEIDTDREEAAWDLTEIVRYALDHADFNPLWAGRIFVNDPRRL